MVAPIVAPANALIVRNTGTFGRRWPVLVREALRREPVSRPNATGWRSTIAMPRAWFRPCRAAKSTASVISMTAYSDSDGSENEAYQSITRRAILAPLRACLGVRQVAGFERDLAQDFRLYRRKAEKIDYPDQ